MSAEDEKEEEEEFEYDTGKFILVDHKPVHTKDLMLWGRWMQEHQRDSIVKQESVGPYWISTVFLGLDYGHGRVMAQMMGIRPDNPSYRPMLFETMAFHRMGDEKKLEVQKRCSTWDEAIEQHERIVKEFQKAIAG